MIRGSWGTKHRANVTLILFLLLLLIIAPVLAESAGYWVDASSSLGKIGKWNESLDAAEKAIALDPNNKGAWNNKAAALIYLKRYQESLDAADRAVALDPDFYFAWNNRAGALGYLQRYQEALDAADRAISINKFYPLSWVNKGQALLNLGDYQGALNATEEAIELNPSEKIAWNSKSSIFIKLKQYQEALDAADKAIALDPAYSRAWANKGNALKSLGRYQEALVAYDKALSLDPDYEPVKSSRQFILSYNLTSLNTNQPVTSQTVTLSLSTPEPTLTVSSDIQDNPEFFFPLVLIILIIVLGTFGYYFHTTRTGLSPYPWTSSQSPRSDSHHDVFISYAQNDKTIADATCAKLESHNIRCWIAPRDVPPGENYPKAIIEGIEGSRVMVLIFSSHSNNSHHVVREMTSAVNKDLIIIPFRIENILPSKDIEYLISASHWLDAITPPLEEHLNKLTQVIEKILSSDTSDTDEKAV